MSRDAARVIICEPLPRWAVLLRRFAPELDISEARSLALADDMLRNSSACLVAVAVTDANVADVLLRLAQWQRSYPACVTVALMDQLDEDVELALRETGAQLVIDSLFKLPTLASLAHRVKACAVA